MIMIMVLLYCLALAVHTSAPMEKNIPDQVYNIVNTTDPGRAGVDRGGLPAVYGCRGNIIIIGYVQGIYVYYNT